MWRGRSSSLPPNIGAQYFRDIAEIVNAAGGPDPVKVVEVMTRYGLVLSLSKSKPDNMAG